MPASDGRREAECVFCALEVSGRVLLENELALCIADAFPLTPGHSLALEASGRMLLENELALYIADADPVTPGHSLVIPQRHGGADGLA
jgi:diadenosine tetraphosphate (Ap4A) HIT family hydrolase